MLTNNQPYSFLLIDDHMIVRTGLRILITEEFNDGEIDEADNTFIATKMIEKKKYDLIILDVNIPDDNIFDFVIYMKAIDSEQKILIFSMNNEEMYTKKILNLGARGYLSKQSSDKEVKRAIALVLQNRIYVSENMQGSILGSLTTNKANESANPFKDLTIREFEIVGLVLKGETTSRIGQILNLQISTVSTHKSHIFNKLNIKNPLQLAELARLYEIDIDNSK